MSIVTVYAAGSRVYLISQWFYHSSSAACLQVVVLGLCLLEIHLQSLLLPSLELRLALSSHTTHAPRFGHHVHYDLPVSLLSPTFSLLVITMSSHINLLLVTPLSQHLLLEIFVEGCCLQSSPLAVHDHDHLRPQLFYVSPSRRSSSSLVLPAHRS